MERGKSRHSGNGQPNVLILMPPFLPPYAFRFLVFLFLGSVLNLGISEDEWREALSDVRDGYGFFSLDKFNFFQVFVPARMKLLNVQNQ